MQLIRKIALCFAATFCLPVILIAYKLPTAAPESVGLSAEKLKDARAAMQKLVDEKRIAGGVFAVARRGKVVQFETCGMMDVEAGKPMKRDTIFRFYSMSKPITSVAAMILYEEGKIKLDDPVSKYIPEFERLKVVADPDAEVIREVAAGREMSVRDLMLLNKGEFGGERLLKAETVEMMTKNQLPEIAYPIGAGDRAGVGFGLGFSVRVESSNGESSSRVGGVRLGRNGEHTFLDIAK